MVYQNNIVFAIRTIKIYKKVLGELPGYSHTLALGALLNILSAIFPDTDFLVNTNAMRGRGLPYLDSPTKSDVESYLKTLRNSLAHKTEENFSSISCDDSNQIYLIDLTSERSDSHLRMTSADLNSVIEILDSAIKTEYTELYERENA